MYSYTFQDNSPNLITMKIILLTSLIKETFPLKVDTLSTAID